MIHEQIYVYVYHSSNATRIKSENVLT